MNNAFYYAIISIVILSGCARDIDSNVYTHSNIDEASKTYEGTIVSVRGAVVKNADLNSDNTTGMILGGVLGGVTGSAFGGGNGKIVASALGAAAGATAGSLIQGKASKQNAVEYVVKLNNGQLYTIVQGKDVIYGKGQKVFVSIGSSNRPRIIGAA